MSATYKQLCCECENWTDGVCEECNHPVCDDCIDDHEVEHDSEE